jgi:hypothetical protein
MIQSWRRMVVRPIPARSHCRAPSQSQTWIDIARPRRMSMKMVGRTMNQTGRERRQSQKAITRKARPARS